MVGSKSGELWHPMTFPSPVQTLLTYTLISGCSSSLSMVLYCMDFCRLSTSGFSLSCIRFLSQLFKGHFGFWLALDL